MRKQQFPYLTIGLTGSIASGKSTALQAWKQMGAGVLSCDDLVREISARSTVQKKIQTQLGCADKESLAKCIFSNPVARKKLENLLHPLVKKEMLSRLKNAPELLQVVEVPLLFEAGWQALFDMTLAVVMPEKLRLACAKRRGISKTDFVKRDKTQWPQQQKAARADLCILNDGSKKDLENKVHALYRALYQLYTVQ